MVTMAPIAPVWIPTKMSHNPNNNHKQPKIYYSYKPGSQKASDDAVSCY
jgi:hypothetical protein